MALAVQSTTNLYNPVLEGLSKTDLIRRGLASGGFQEDAANKAFGGPSHVVLFTTTDATPEVFLSLGAAFTRTGVPNPLGSPSLNDTLTLPGVDVTTVARVRRITCEISANASGVRTFAKVVGVVRNAATPTAQTQLTATEGVQLGTVTLTFAAGRVDFTITGPAAAVSWQVKVFVDDLQ